MNKDEGEAISVRSTRSRPLAPWWQQLPSPDDLAKLVAVASAVLYGILFLAYRTYYAAVDIGPEDVGVTNSFVLARVFGFILVTLAMGAVVVGFLFLASGFTPGSRTIADLLRKATLVGLGGALCAYFYYLFPSISNWAPLLVVVALFPSVVALNLLKRSRFAPYWPFAFVFVAVVASVVIPSIAVVHQAAQLGQKARGGERVTSFNVFAIPIVDVSAPKIKLHWANPTIPYPPELFGHGQIPEPAMGVLLGQGNDVVIANILVGKQHRVVRLNAATVIVELL